MQERYDAVTIGSGLGGLTAAALAARAGKRVLLLERNRGFGGAATTYRHGALTVEASLHDTTDPHDPRDPKARIFRALGILDELTFVPVGDFYQVRGGPFATPFDLPTGQAAARERLAAAWPQHAKAFDRFFDRLQAVQEAIGTLGEQHDSLWWVLHAPLVPLKVWPLLRDLRLSLSEVLDQAFGGHEAPKLALAANLPYYGDDPDRLWWVFFAVAQGGYLSGGAYYVKGGSQALTDCLLRVLREEGGVAASGRQVVEILLDGEGRAAGVVHAAADGSDRQEVLAPLLFANAAPQELARCLPQAARAAFLAPYEGRPLSISLFSAAFGLSRPPQELGLERYSTVLLPPWVERLADYRRSAALLAEPPGAAMPVMVAVNYSAIDSGLQQGGLHLVSAVGVDRLENWAGLEPAAYAARREQWLDAIQGAFERHFPGFSAAVTQREMATAATLHHFLNTPGGAIYGFAPQPPAALPPKMGERALTTSVPGLLLASSFGGFGGFTGAMMTGPLAAQTAVRHGL